MTITSLDVELYVVHQHVAMVETLWQHVALQIYLFDIKEGVCVHCITLCDNEFEITDQFYL